MSFGFLSPLKEGRLRHYGQLLVAVLGLSLSARASTSRWLLSSGPLGARDSTQK